MGPYRALLIAVTVLSFLSVAGMREIRASLVVAILFINAFGWGWELFNKWNTRRNQLAVQGERELQVGNYSEVEESLAKPDAERLAKRRQKLALAYHHAGDHAAAVPHFDRALELHEQAFGPDHSETGKMLSETGAALHKAGDHAEALRRLERALQIQE